MTRPTTSTIWRDSQIPDDALWRHYDATLADLQHKRRAAERKADEWGYDNDPSIAAMYEAEADALAGEIAAHLSRTAQMAADRIAHDREDVPEQTEGTGVMGYLIGAVLIVAALLVGIPLYCLLLFWTGGLSL